MFPINNKNALDKFRGGKWKSLEFDSLALLCQSFPYISYPIQHTQDLYRDVLLGQGFWDIVDGARQRNYGVQKVRRVHLPGSKDRVEVKLPGRITMQEILEYSKRKTSVERGKRVVVQEAADLEVCSVITKERDEQIANCPLLNMIRNPRCMYHVPPIPRKLNVESRSKSSLLELPQMTSEPGQGAGSSSRGGVRLARVVVKRRGDDDSSSGSECEDSEGEEESMEGDGRMALTNLPNTVSVPSAGSVQLRLSLPPPGPPARSGTARSAGTSSRR